MDSLPAATDDPPMTAIGHGLVRMVSLPAYFLACAAGLGLVGLLAAADGASGLALFAGVHTVLALVAAGWRAQEMGMVPAGDAPVAPARTDRPPVPAARVPTGAGSPST